MELRDEWCLAWHDLQGSATLSPMRIRSLNHSRYQHQYHIVWNTKYRYKILKPYVKQTLLDSFDDTARRHPEICIDTVNTDDDHVHLQIEIAPSVSVAKAVGALKANASIALKREHKFIKKMYLDGSIWSVGYFSSTIGLNEEVIRNYVQNQGRRDYPKTLQQRLRIS